MKREQHKNRLLEAVHETAQDLHKLGFIGSKSCRFRDLPFIISPKIATELYRHERIEAHLAKGAIEKMRIEGRYAPDIIAEALLRIKEIGNVETGNSEAT